MPRPLNEIVAHIRMVAANPSISTTLIQTEDLLALCDAAEAIDLTPHRERMVDAVLAHHFKGAIECFPEGRPNMKAVRAENESYRPYAERDVDAIIATLAAH